MATLVSMKNIRKEFPGVIALHDVNFDLRAGEVHLLLGENGAGKSTLMKILSGIYSPTKGEIFIEGKEYHSLTPKLSSKLGISIIYQELSVVNELSIAENLFIGHLPTKEYVRGLKIVDKKYVRLAQDMVDKIGLKRSVSTLVANLSISEKQMVEIAKALVQKSKILVMDEPTSSLSNEEAERLFHIIRQLRTNGIGIVYISHKLKELREIGDRVTVLKDGRTVATKDMNEISGEDEIISMMVGRNVQKEFFSSDTIKYTQDNILFRAKNISRKDDRVKDVSFELYKGEVLGIAGLVGAGRTELMNTIFTGEEYKDGAVYLGDKRLSMKSPYHSIKNGVALITENRRETGIFPNFHIRENLVLVKRLLRSKLYGLIGLIHPVMDRATAFEQKDRMQIKCSSLDQLITELSGGNQQKVIVGKWLASNAKVFIFDEPTKGIDIGTKSEMYIIMRKLADEGIGVIMISSEMAELLGICDRILVLHEGILKGVLPKGEATEEKILKTALS